MHRVRPTMGRGRKALCFRLDLPARIGAVSLVWRAGYELHVVVPTPVAVEAPGGAQATIDLGEIHLAAVTTTSGQALIVSGRGIRSLKRRHNQSLGQLQRKQARCTKGSRRWRKLQWAKARLRARTERQVRDRRHKATRQVVRFLGTKMSRWCSWGTRMGSAPRMPGAITING